MFYVCRDIVNKDNLVFCNELVSQTKKDSLRIDFSKFYLPL